MKTICGILAALTMLATPTQAPVVDTVSQLEKLAVLMEKGILTQEEFQAQKAKILQL